MPPINQSLGIDQCNCFAMRKAARQISRFYDAHLESSGLRITQFLTLAALNELGSAAVSALAERLDIERTAGKWWTFCSATAWSRSSRRPLTVEAASSNSPRREAVCTKKRARFGGKRNENSSD